MPCQQYPVFVEKKLAGMRTVTFLANAKMKDTGRKNPVKNRREQIGNSEKDDVIFDF